jgi:hypothetical protein
MSCALVDGPNNPLFLFLDLLGFDPFPPLLISQLALGIHFLVRVLAHRNFPTYASLDAGRILDSVRRENLHEIA